MKISIPITMVVVLSIVPGCGRIFDDDSFTVDKILYTPPAASDDGLIDDILPTKPVEFNPSNFDSRTQGDWQVNLSQAVTRLDVPMVKPDVEPTLVELMPSYKAAVDASRAGVDHSKILPSVNMIDGKGKQFDDGLYASLDLAYYRGLDGALASHVGLIERLLARVGPDSPATAFLAAGLELAGKKVEVGPSEARARYLKTFLDNEIRSKPIGFYTWSRELTDTFRFLRFFQQTFPGNDLAIPRTLARAFETEPMLLSDYRKVLTFYARLSNPSLDRSVADLIGHDEPQPARTVFALFPSSTSRETELFEKLFPQGLPPNANLIKALVAKIRSGEVDLRPRDDSGWYDHQVYALETMLLPELGDEHEKLLLTRSYKRRMLDAFQALLTKRRETHYRNVKSTETVTASPAPLTAVAPRLRLEPCPSFYLRTARSYTFLAYFLRDALGEASLKSLHGLREGGERPIDLGAELESIRELFYGFYLISAEDIGLEPACFDTDGVEPKRCREAALAWLMKPEADPDLAVDTRVSVPIYVDGNHRVTQTWATLGVRLARLEASYARGPMVKPLDGSKDWAPVPSYLLATSDYLIPVDEVAEVELKGLRVLNRPEFRKICDVGKTKEAIVKAMAR